MNELTQQLETRPPENSLRLAEELQIPQDLARAVGKVMLVMRAESAKQMEKVNLELRAITNDNSVLRNNLALLNTGMADFQREQVIPLRSELANLREEQGGRVIENARKLEALIQALTVTLDAKGALIPPDLKQQIMDGRFEELEHAREGELVNVAQVQAMIEEAYLRGRADALKKVVDDHEATANDGDLKKSDA